MRSKILITVGVLIVLICVVLWNYKQIKGEADHRVDEQQQAKLRETCEMHQLMGTIRPDLPGICDQVLSCAGGVEDGCAALLKSEVFRECTGPCLTEGRCRRHRKECVVVDDFLCSLSTACREESRCRRGNKAGKPGGVCLAKP